VPGAFFRAKVSTRVQTILSHKVAAMAFDPNSSHDLNAFLAMPVPRRIPFWLRKQRTTSATFPAIIGMLFIGMGTFFCWVFLPFHLPKQWKLDRGPALEATGKVFERTPTKLSINRVKVYQYRYRFSEENGAAHEGVAFTTGSRWNEGAKVDVYYLPSDPSISVIDGARMGASNASSLFVLAFPVVGACFLAAPLIVRSSRNRLFRSGRVTTATIASLQKTWTKVNNQQQYKITVTRDDDGGTAMRRTHDPAEIAYAEEKLREGLPVPILYNPRKPKRWLFPELWKP
jgi:hypothetical protein